jgi:alpha-ribazole phosphatase
MLYSSGLQRARQLAQALHTLRDNLVPEIDLRLNEMDFGAWEGIAWDAIPQTAFDTWIADFDAHRFGDVESVRDVLMRTSQALEECSCHENVVWVTHAGVIRAINYLKQYGLNAPATSDKWPVKAPAFGEYQCLTF